MKLLNILGTDISIIKKTVLFRKYGLVILALLALIALPLTMIIYKNNEKPNLRNIKVHTSACTCTSGGIIDDQGVPHPDGDGTGYCGQTYNSWDNTSRWACCGSTAAGNVNGWVQNACPQAPQESFGCNVAAQDGYCGGGDIIDAATGNAICPNSYTGYPGQQVCGSNHKNYICIGGGWAEDTSRTGYCGGSPTGCDVTPVAGQCGNGHIEDAATGKPICKTFTGNDKQPVCGDDGYNYVCNGATGAWDPLNTKCGPAQTATCKSDGITSIACGGVCYCIGSGDSTCDRSHGLSPASACLNGKWICSQDKTTPICPAPSTNPQPSGNPPPSSNPQPSGNPNPSGSNPSPSTSNPSPSTSPVPSPSVSSPAPSSSTAPSPSVTNPVSTATPTTAPGTTALTFFLTLDGVGKNTGIGQNNSPVTTNETVEVKIFDISGNQVMETSGTLTYDANDAAFKGNVTASALGSGAYNIKARFNNTLWKKISSSISAGTTNKLAAAKLINGDLNGDNVINLLDYNGMISCVGGRPCPQKNLADLNLDGKVDELDLNVLYSHFVAREGD